MKVYITKYALTRGILEADADVGGASAALPQERN